MKRTPFLLLLTFIINDLSSQTIVPQLNHDNLIHQIRFSSEGEFIASAARDEIKIWQTSTKALMGTLDGHGSEIKQIELSQNKNVLISADRDSIYLWDLISFEQRKSFYLGKNGSFSLSQDWSQLAVSTGDRNILLLDPLTFSKINSVHLEDKISWFAFKSAFELVVIADKDLLIYDMNKKALTLQKKKIVSKTISHFQILKTSGDLILGLKNSAIEVFRAPEYSMVTKILVDEKFFDIDANEKSNSLAISTKGKTVEVFSLITGLKTKSIKTTTNEEIEEPIRCFGYSPNADVVATAGYKKGLFTFSTYNDIAILDISTGNIAYRIGGLLNKVERIITRKNNQAVLLAGDQIFLWDFNTGTVLDFIDLEINENDKVKKGFFKSINEILTYSAPILEWVDSSSFVVKYPSSLFSLYRIKDQKFVKENLDLKGEYFFSAIEFNKADPSRYLIAKAIPDSIIYYYEGNQQISEIKTGSRSRPGETIVDLDFDNKGRFFVAITSSGALYWHYMFGARIGKYDATASGMTRSYYNFVKQFEQYVIFSSNGTIYKLNTDFLSESLARQQYARANNILRCTECKLVDVVSDTLVVADRSLIHKINHRTGKYKTIRLENKIISAAILDNGHLLTGSADGGINYCEPNGKKILDIYLRSAHHVLINKKSEYAFSKDGYALVQYRYKGILYPFDDFDLYFNRPDQIFSKFPGSSEEKISLLEKAYSKRIGRVGRLQKNEMIELPEITILNKEHIPSITKADTVTLKFKITASRYPVSRWQILINGIPVKGAMTSGNNYVTEKLALSEGLNKIQIYATDQQNRQSFKNTVFINCNRVKRKSSLYLATISAENYKDPSLNLTYPIDDAKALFESFNRSGAYENVFHLNFSDDAVNASSLKAIQQFFSKAKVDDQVILFYAGHGFLDKDLNFYLATYDLSKDNLIKTGIPFGNVEEIFSALTSRNRLALIDACHSGDYDRQEIETLVAGYTGKRSAPTPAGSNIKRNLLTVSDFTSYDMMKELFYNVTSTSGLNIISASAANQYALESNQWSHGAFTYALLEFINDRKGDKNHDGTQNISELKEYVTERVTELTGGRQKPTMRDGNINADFILLTKSPNP